MSQPRPPAAPPQGPPVQLLPPPQRPSRLVPRLFAATALIAAIAAAVAFIVVASGDDEPEPFADRPPALASPSTATPEPTPAPARPARKRPTRRSTTSSTTAASGRDTVALPVDVAIDGSRPSPPAPARPRVPGSRSVTAGGFSIALPPHWRPDVVDRDRGAYVHSAWHLDGSPRVRLVLDYTPNASGGARGQAAPVRAAVRRQPGYSEIEWRRGRVARRSWRWRFRLGGIEKFDTFAVVCGTGYAVMTEAPVGEYPAHAAEFDALRQSFKPRC